GRIDGVELDPELAAEFEGLPETVSARLGGAEITGALEEIRARVRRLNRYVEERQPWQLAKDDGAAAELDRVLASLHEGLRVVTVLLAPYLPAATARLLSALGRPEVTLDDARFAGGTP